MTMRIDVEDLNVYYGDFLAVEGASITMAPLTVTAFIGPSGCGKSTVLRTLNRMHEVILGGHITGTVLLDGRNLTVRALTRSTSAAPSAWSSSNPTRSRP